MTGGIEGKQPVPALELPEQSTPPDALRNGDDDTFDLLSEILLGQYRERLGQLNAELSDVEATLRAIEGRMEDKDALVDLMTPIIASAIGTSIKESQESMVEALYPIMGRLVTRAVAEAMRDLVRSVDLQMRNTFTVQGIGRRLEARARGISLAELTVRAALPFRIVEVLLIHRESGLLLRHVSHDGEAFGDSDLVSGMLTAIRDFAQDTFGPSEDGQLNEIQYGDHRIIIEVAEFIYMAVVVQGFEPRQFRDEVREVLIHIQWQVQRDVRSYDGNAARFAEVDSQIRGLMQTAEAAAGSEPVHYDLSFVMQQITALPHPPVRVVLMGLLAIVALCLVGWGVSQLMASGQSMP